LSAGGTSVGRADGSTNDCSVEPPLKIRKRDIITESIIKAKAPKAAILSLKDDFFDMARKITPQRMTTPTRIRTNIGLLYVFVIKRQESCFVDGWKK
jgi:hypothetical protein